MDLDEITKEMNVDREELWCIITLESVGTQAKQQKCISRK